MMKYAVSKLFIYCEGREKALGLFFVNFISEKLRLMRLKISFSIT